MPEWGYCVWVSYEVEATVPEDELERLAVEHGHHHCEECPLFVIPNDKRRVWGSCPEREMTKKNSCVCKRYFLDREGGNHEPPRMGTGMQEGVN